MRLQFFSHSRNRTTTKTLITKLHFLHPMHRIHNGLQNGPKSRPNPPLHGLSLNKSPIKNHATLFGSDRVIKLDQTKLGSTKPNKSPTWRLVQSPTSTAILQETIPHPCNSSSYPQARRPIEAAHSFNFSIMTPLVNMSAGFLDPQIFSSITSLSSTR